MSLDPRLVSRAMRLSIVEGVFYALMVGFGETYFLANAVRLGASTVQQALVVALPLFAGAAGSVLSLRALANLRRRKTGAVVAATGEAAVLASVAVTDALGALGPGVLIGLACLSQACMQATGTIWSSWYGDLVPAEVRGRYFGVRTRYVHAGTCVGLVGAGLMLHELEPGAAGALPAGAGGFGFLSIFALASVFRLCSVGLLALSPEPPFRGLTPPARAFRFLRTARGRTGWRLLGAGALMQLVVYTSSPYFGPFMLVDLEFTYMEYMAATVTMVAAKSLLLPMWGRMVDAHGGRTVYALAVVLVALVPLPWLWADGIAWVAIAQAVSGFAWGGYEVSYFTQLLENSYRGTRPHVFAAQNVLNGTAQLCGGLIGALLAGPLGLALRTLFAVSLLGRLAVGLAFPRLVPPGKPLQSIGRADLFLRVVGVRPHGGVVHRPVYEPGEGE